MVTVRGEQLGTTNSSFPSFPLSTILSPHSSYILLGLLKMRLHRRVLRLLLVFFQWYWWFRSRKMCIFSVAVLDQENYVFVLSWAKVFLWIRIVLGFLPESTKEFWTFVLCPFFNVFLFFFSNRYFQKNQKNLYKKNHEWVRTLFGWTSVCVMIQDTYSHGSSILYIRLFLYKYLLTL